MPPKRKAPAATTEKVEDISENNGVDLGGSGDALHQNVARRRGLGKEEEKPTSAKTKPEKRAKKASADEKEGEEPKAKAAKGRKLAKINEEDDSKEPVKERAEEPKAKVTKGRKAAKTNEDEAENKDPEAGEPKAKATKGRKVAKTNEEDETKEPAEKPKRGHKAAKPSEEPIKKPTSRAVKKPLNYTEETVKEESPKKKRKVGVKGKTAVEEEDNEVDEKKPANKKVVAKKEAKEKKTKQVEEPKAKVAAENKTETDWNEVTFTTDKKNRKGESANLTITTWNVDGLRAWLKKGGLSIIDRAKPDILCLQETKVSEDKLPDEVKSVPGYHAHWCASNKDGYAGVGLLTREKPISFEYGIGNEEQDEDGRCITAEFEEFYVVGVYVPNAGRKLVTLPKRLDWNEAFKSYVLKLNDKKPVIICGDMNVAHQEVDLANPKTNTKNAGFTKEERDGLSEFLGEGFVDVYRELYPDQKDVYTFWTYMSKSRAKNVGWRLDYFILPENLMENVCDVLTHTNVYGSDHCPLSLLINI